ncbi:MAG: hypothetical protein ACTHU0_26095 [Kofleriaceae bacterium]
MPTHLDQHLDYDADKRPRLTKAPEEKSGGPVMLVVVLVLFALVIYYYFIR